MKRIIAVFLTVLMTLALMTSCQKKDDDSKQKVATAPDKNADIINDTPETPLKISVRSADVAVGDVFTVTVILENTEWTWSSFEFVASYDPNIVKIKSVNKTEFTNGMMDMCNLQYKNNQVKVAYATADDMEGGGELVQIECEALAAGSFEMQITDALMYRWVTYAATGEGGTQEIPLNIENGTITVK